MHLILTHGVIISNLKASWVYSDASESQLLQNKFMEDCRKELYLVPFLPPLQKLTLENDALKSGMKTSH